MRLPKALFANTFVLYGLTLAVGIAASWQHVLSPAMNAIAPLTPCPKVMAMVLLTPAVWIPPAPGPAQASAGKPAAPLTG